MQRVRAGSRDRTLSRAFLKTGLGKCVGELPAALKPVWMAVKKTSAAPFGKQKRSRL